MFGGVERLLTSLEDPQEHARCLAGFQRFYGLNWRQQRREIFWVDLMVLVLKLDDYEWGYTDENIASLIDPEVKKAHEQRKRSGAKPPPKPIIYPIAQRPQHAAARRAKELLAQVAEVEKKPAKKRISIRQFREGIGR